MSLLVTTGLLLAGCLNQGKPADLGLTDVGEGVKIEDRVSELADQFGVTIPETVEKTLLEAVDGSPSSGLATREIVTDQIKLTVLANLPEAQDGYLARLLSDGDSRDLGLLQVTKGGWLLETSAAPDLESYRTVEIIRGDEVVLRGSFDQSD